MAGPPIGFGGDLDVVQAGLKQLANMRRWKATLTFWPPTWNSRSKSGSALAPQLNTTPLKFRDMGILGRV